MEGYYVENKNVIGGIVEIEQSGRYLKTERGFLVIESTGETRSVLARIDYDQFDALVCSNAGFTVSGPLLAALVERNKSFVITGKDFQPAGMLLPLSDNMESIRRIQYQLKATRPLMKRLWQKIVQEKITNQANVLLCTSKNEQAGKLNILSRKVLSGDSDNREAQAARMYWPALFGSQFLRSNDEDPINGMLNYGYAILRSSICRSLVAFGLLPMFGIHHANLRNYFALADDMLEPFRPLVDWKVSKLIQSGKNKIDSEVKTELCSLLIMDVPMAEQTMPLANAIRRSVGSLVESYAQKKVLLCLPNIRECLAGM